uniref:RING-type domain-containing protein n=1 Tax=viral metagenome TaxID=1070528 RepID=A0A6C0F398_9ZZZZ
MPRQSKNIRQQKSRNKKTRRKTKGGVPPGSSNLPPRKKRQPAAKKEKPATKEKMPATKEKMSAPEEETETYLCAICFEELSENIMSCSGQTAHNFHEECILPWCMGRRPCRCPICKEEVVTYFDDAYKQDIYKPREGEPVTIGQGIPNRLEFTLLPPSFENKYSAISPDSLRRWPPNYRPTTDEIREWDIKMPWKWWTEPGQNNLPLGWYEQGYGPKTIVIDGRRYYVDDPEYRPNTGVVYEERAYEDEYGADAPSWMIVGNQNQVEDDDEEFQFPLPPPRQAPPPPPPREVPPRRSWWNPWS